MYLGDYAKESINEFITKSFKDFKTSKEPGGVPKIVYKRMIEIIEEE